MQLASMWSRSCNIQHLAQQQHHHTIQWSMLRTRTFDHFQLANTAYRRTNPHDHIIKRIKARVTCTQEGSELWENCTTYDLKRSFRRRNDRKLTFQATKIKGKGSTIMWIERPQWQESESKTQRHWLCKSRNIWGMLKRHDRQRQSPKHHLWSCWMLQ